MRTLAAAVAILFASTALSALAPTAAALEACTGLRGPCPGVACSGKDENGRWEQCYLVFVVCVTEPCDAVKVCDPCPPWWP